MLELEVVIQGGWYMFILKVSDGEGSGYGFFVVEILLIEDLGLNVFSVFWEGW